MTGKGKGKGKEKPRRRADLAGSKRKPGGGDDIESAQKRPRCVTPEPPSTPTAAPVVVAISKSPAKLQKPAAAAAAAAATAMADDDSLLCDEEKLPTELPAVVAVAPSVYTHLGAVSIIVQPDGTPTQCVPGQVLHHMPKKAELELSKRAVAAAAASDSTVDYKGESAASITAGNIYIPTDVLSQRHGGPNLVVKAVRLSDQAVFVMKIMPNHGVKGTSAHEKAYIAERKDVLRALSGCDWNHVVQCFSLNVYDKETPCATLRMQLMNAESMEAAMFSRQNSAANVMMALGDMLAAVASVHRLGIVHGAVFASNFLSDIKTGAWKLSDFESAAIGVRSLRNDKTWLTAATSRIPIHKGHECASCSVKDIPMAYRAPEHAHLDYHDRAIITSAMDIWGVGVILYIIVTRMTLVAGGSYAEIDKALDDHFANEDARLGEFRTAAVLECGFAGQQLDDLCSLLKQLIARNPEDRIDADGALRSPLFTPRRGYSAAAAAAPAVVMVPESPSAPDTPLSMSSQVMATPPPDCVPPTPVIQPDFARASPSIFDMDPPALSELAWASPTGVAAAAASVMYTPVLEPLMSP